ncbi:MAG: DUF2235 domain-containing protein [Mariniphaga sp.]
MKRIAIFCDGTWETPDENVDGKLCQTNVVKMANALSDISEDGKTQLLYYETGIGSEGSLIERVYDGATGFGISENILKAYRFIIKNYEQGDELFFFGFSRGAFTVRSLAGLIRNSGILKRENIELISRAYSLYQSRKPEHQPREVEATLFRRTFAVSEMTKIKFIGVWDTVGALGNPLFLNGVVSRKNGFHDTDLSTRIENAFHALAIEEKRKNFQAALWHQQKGSGNQVLEQMWFPGTHGDVGGGYIDGGLSDLTLGWMLEKAQSCLLKFDPIPINPDPMAAKHESYTSFYKLQPPFYRPIGVKDPKKGPTNESVHPSVIERYKTDPSFRPDNLVKYLKEYPL